MNEIIGDILTLAKQGQFDVIIQGCNCFCTMGAGLAKAIKTEFPEAYSADQTTIAGDRGKLGSYSQASIINNGYKFIIVNAYTQYDWRGRGKKADYVAIQSVFSKIKRDFPALRIAYPLIGAGLAGGDWDEISKIIEAELQGLNHSLVRLSKG